MNSTAKLGKKSSKLGIWRQVARLAPFIKERRGIMAAMIVCGLAGSAADVAMPLFERYALDVFVTEGDLSSVLPFAAAYALTVF
ncbi:MAG: hypothetical protein K6C36_04520, partial [Clostridia bacterium]|nr:hypothetical protein [Clostridia bacterium]